MNDRTNKGDSELGSLARRRIEAAIIAPIYNEMREAVGEAKARDILRRAIRRAAIDAGTEMASRADGEADLESFKAILPLWTKDDALTIEVIDDKPGVLDHIAFWGTDPSAYVAKLKARGIKHDLRRLPENGHAAGLWQLFFFDPSGARVEIDFAASETVERQG